MNTTYITKQTDIKREWHLVNLEGQILGRAASEIAKLLQGKHKVYFTPQLDCGDYVVAINADKVKVSGRKATNKMYYHHSNYPSGLKQVSFNEQMNKDPRKIIEWAMAKMLPKNKLRDQRLARLKIFVGSEHTYKDKFKKE
jgi:large subunit ribosomal protein L13